MDKQFEKQPVRTPNERAEKIHYATQNELFKSTLDSLKGGLSGAGIDCVSDKEYLRLKRGDKQVGIVFKMPDGNRTVVRLDSDLQTIIKEFESSIQPDSIFVSRHGKDLTDFTFFPNLTEGEVRVLQTEIEPIAGHIVIVQGEYVIANKQDKTHLITTFGISSCRGIIIYDPEKGTAAAAHSDTEYADIPLIQRMRADLIRAGSNLANLRFYGTPNIDPQTRQYVIDRMFSEKIYEVPSEFTFDCATGLITPFDPKSLPRSANLDQRINDEVDIRLKHNIPYIRKGIKEFVAKEQNL
jgi:hypothetical protein